MSELLLTNIGMLATPTGSSARSGAEQGQIQILRNAWVLISQGQIAQVGTGTPPSVNGAQVVDAGGKLVTPGLVDAHTHLIFGGWRQNELGMKLHGKSYLDIQNAGGGIQSTTNATRQATEEELTQKAAKALDEMMRFGTTTCEAKSGYGLALEHELKQLRAIRRLQEEHPMDVTATFMGAHLVPAEYKQDRAEYIRLVCEEMMPAVKEQGIAKFCDVFCEADTFTVEESRQILEAGLRHGLRPKIHADEIESIGGSQLAGEIGAISAEHLIVCPPEGIAQHGQGRRDRLSAARHQLLSGLHLCPGPGDGVRRCAGGHGLRLQPGLLPLPQPAVRHQSGVPALPTDPGRGADSRYSERCRSH